MQGKSKIQLDADTVNILLKEFAAKDGTDVVYRNGKIQVDKNGLKVTLSELPLKNTKLKVDGSFGSVNLELAEFQLNDTEIYLDVEVSPG